LNEEQTSGRTMKYLEILEMGNYSTTDEWALNDYFER
jgi:hypothetical protein